MARILVIDDDVPVCESFELLLEEYGHDVCGLTSAREVEALLKEKTFDLAIVDIYMPEMDGLETIKLLRSISPDLKIIAMSGKKPGTFNPLTAAEAYGAMFMMEKPVGAAKLTEIIDQALAT